MPTGMLVVLVVFLLLAILYVNTLEKALERCDEQSRTISPGSVGLLLIPVLNLVYQFYAVGHLARSLGNEFARRGITVEDREPGKALGVAMCVLNVAAFAGSGSNSGGPPLLWAAAVCWLVYWRRIVIYSRMIAEPHLSSPEHGNALRRA